MKTVLQLIEECDPITEESFQQFCDGLNAIDKLFHLEDDPMDIEDMNHVRTFTPTEAYALRGFLGEAWKFVIDPMEQCCKASGLRDEEE